MTIQEKLKAIVASHKEVRSLVDIQAQVVGVEAYDYICKALGIKPYFTHESYRTVRNDIKERHLRGLLRVWSEKHGVEASVTLSYTGNDALSIWFSPNAAPVAFTNNNLEHSDSTSARVEELLVKFSIYWECVQ